MEKMVEVERATQEELRQDLKSLFQGAIRVTLEMVLRNLSTTMGHSTGLIREQCPVW